MTMYPATGIHSNEQIHYFSKKSGGQKGPHDLVRDEWWWERESLLTSFYGHCRPFSAHARLHTNWTLSTLGEVAAPKFSGWSSANLVPQICHKIRSTPNLNWRQFFGSAHPNGGRQVCGKMELVCLFVSPHLESALGSQVHVSLDPFPNLKKWYFHERTDSIKPPFFFASSTTLAAIK